MKSLLLVKLFALAAGTSSLTLGTATPYNGSFKLDNLDQTIVGGLKEFIMVSPSGTLTPAIIYDGSTRSLYYSLEGEIDDISKATGKLGFITSTDDFATAFTDEVTMTDAENVHEEYDTISGKSDHISYDYHKYTLTATNGFTGKQMQIECRVYDTGFAFRYKFSSDGETIVKDNPLKYTEQTTFNLYKGSGTRFVYEQASTGKYAEDYENLYQNTSKDESDHKWRSFPFLETQKDKPTILFAEAGLDGTYCDSCLHRIGDHVLQVTPTYQQLYYDYNFMSRTIKMNDFVSPWRAFIIGNYGDIVTSNLIEALNEECVVEDTSWIKPGVCSWSWKDGGFDAQSNEAKHKEFIDFASDMGWKYFILDEGWPLLMNNSDAVSKGLVDKTHQDTSHMPNHNFMYAIRPNTPRLVQYAKERNVGLIAWIHNSQICDPYDDYAKMDGVFASLAAAGFKGIKADFFEYPTQNLDQQLRKLYELSAKYHLMVNIHGSNLPTGERRTYPNVINREAIFGQENERDKDRINPTLIISNAFVRGVVGPVDFTPYVYAAEDTHLQLTSQMALPIIFESGLTCIASRPEAFEKNVEPAKEAKNFYRNLPSSWKQTKYISGSPVLGDNFSLVLARQAKNGDWYVGGVFDDAISGGYDLDLSFLGEGTYRAEIFKGKADRQKANYEFMNNITKDTIIQDLPIVDNGGFVVRITNVENRININCPSPLEVKAYRDEDPSMVITPGDKTQLGHKIDLEITAPSEDLLPENVYVNGEPFYVKRDTIDSCIGIVSGINEVYQNIEIVIAPQTDTRPITITSSSVGSVAVCDDLRKYYKSGDIVKVGTHLIITLKYDKDSYNAQLIINDETPISVVDTYELGIDSAMSKVDIKVTYTSKA